MTQEQESKQAGKHKSKKLGESCINLLAFLPLSGWVDGVVLAVGLIAIAFGLGSYGFYEPHEGHFAGVAREMLLRGDFVTPYLNGAPYLNKPPLLYWLIATSTALFGTSEAAARLPLAIAGWVGAAIAWRWATQLWNPLAGRAAALMLCVTTGWFIFTHQILIDVLLSTVLLATYYCLWQYFTQVRWVYLLGFYLLIGLCLLAKGPYVLVFAGAGCGAIALSRQSWSVFRQLRPLLGAGAILAMILPWAIAVERANPGFFHYFIFNENFNRIADRRWPPDYDVSKVSVWGYLAVTGIWCLPWTLLLPQALSSAWMDWKLSGALSEPQRRRGRTQQKNQGEQYYSEGVLLLLVAAALPIVLFVPLSSRLVYYSLPSVAPFVMLCAGWWSRCHNPCQKQGRRVASILLIVLGLGVGSAFLWAPSLVTGLPELSNLGNIGWMVRAIALFIGLGWLLGGVWLLANRPYLALILLFIGTACANATITYGFAAVQDFRSSRNLVQTANPRLDISTLWTFEGSRELGAAGAISYYLNRNPVQASSVTSKISPPPFPIPHSPSPIPVGWSSSKSGHAYHVVMVLKDGGENRILPVFPGSEPGYAIAKQQLQQYWDSPRPVVFVTDFMRQPNDPLDPPERNLPNNAGEPLLVQRPRKLYGNLAARKLWGKR